METRTGLSDAQFVRRVLIVIALIALALLAWSLRNVLLMVFGAVVVATLFRALAGQYERLRLPYGLALALAVVTVFAILAITAVLFGQQLVQQTEALTKAVPQAWESLRGRLEGFGLGGQLDQLSGAGQTSGFASSAGRFAMSLGGGLADALLIVVGGIFIAASPRFYQAGMVKLVPENKRSLVGSALGDSGKALKLWLKAQLLTMAGVGLVTGFGLWLIGMPSALALGLLAALLEFIPFVGPILAALPAVLIALAVDPTMALWVVGVYLVVQQIEGNLLQPLLQQWAVDLPGAVLLFSLLACGTLFGPLGVIFAAPLTVVVYVLIKRLYVKETLNTATPIPGEDAGK
ncbi:AI-2E family transporter [Sphingomonas arenae]|uniref:AI-2E family transporter n=1 Tax=Sphingomonas arenae TaxID=2812555 RepID=UPI0019675933|nr:AI-2E family transporter [Sphingomonas arenae]